MATEVAPPPRPLPFESLAFLQEAVAASAALAAADRLGVLARLEAAPADAATLARDCAIAERGARVLLAALASLGVVEASTKGAQYRTRVPGASRQLAALVRHWEPLETVLRDDGPAIGADTPAVAEALYQDVVADLGAWLAPLAERAADHLAAPGLRILDVGAGAAPWSLALARRDPATCVTTVDLPAVLPATRRAVAESGRAAQFEYLAGDMFTIEWEPSAYDLAIAGNVCHLFGEAANRRFLRRLFGALRPGGTLAILDVVPNERLDGPRPAMLYALGLLLRTREGAAYPFSTYVAWLRDAGYEAIERVDLSGVPSITLITARRPPRDRD
jgi:SAM-dependent methyltransferase